jgi:hypothetical protein
VDWRAGNEDNVGWWMGGNNRLCQLSGSGKRDNERGTGCGDGKWKRCKRHEQGDVVVDGA